MSSITIPTIKPNTKYTGGARLCPGVLGDRLCPVVLALADCKGQPTVAVDDEMVDGCVVGQGYIPGNKDINLNSYWE